MFALSMSTVIESERRLAEGVKTRKSMGSALITNRIVKGRNKESNSFFVGRGEER